MILDAVRAAQEHLRQEVAALHEARKTAERRVTRLTEQMQRLAEPRGGGPTKPSAMAELQDRLCATRSSG